MNVDFDTLQKYCSGVYDKYQELLKQVDVLIDGQFQIDKRDIMLKYRGSSNQRVIDVKKSLIDNKVTEIEL